MKYSFNGVFVVAEAENQQDDQALIDLVKVADLSQTPLKKHKKHKKHNFPKVCEECGKTFKGLQGVEIHKAHVHNIKPEDLPF